MCRAVHWAFKQEAVELFVFGAVELELDDFFSVELGEVDVGCVVEDFGAALAFGMTQDAVAVFEVAVELHVADGDQAVEPGVGDGLHGLRRSRVLRCACQELLARAVRALWKRAAADEHDVALDFGRLDTPFAVIPSRAACAVTAEMNAFRASGA